MNCTVPKNLVWVLGMALQTPRPLYSLGQQRWFEIPKVVGFELHEAKKYCFAFWGGTPNTNTTLPHRPAKVSLDT